MIVPWNWTSRTLRAAVQHRVELVRILSCVSPVALQSEERVASRPADGVHHFPGLPGCRDCVTVHRKERVRAVL
jgi:hypothetical protein